MRYRPQFLAAAVLTAAFFQPVIARIGETPEECAKRYGKASPAKDGEALIYRKSGLVIVVNFLNGKAAQIAFFKSEHDALNNSKPLSDTEIESLLEANKGDSEWVKSEAITFMKKAWQKADQSRYARYDQSSNGLLIITEDYAKKIVDDKASKEKRGLEGF